MTRQTLKKRTARIGNKKKQNAKKKVLHSLREHPPWTSSLVLGHPPGAFHSAQKMPLDIRMLSG